LTLEEVCRMCMKRMGLLLTYFRQTQWDPPAWDAANADEEEEEEEEEDEEEDDMDLGTPTNDDGKVEHASFFISCFNT
jgi:hypothetical protein